MPTPRPSAESDALPPLHPSSPPLWQGGILIAGCLYGGTTTSNVPSPPLWQGGILIAGCLYGGTITSNVPPTTNC
jgi:hypothetical protein